MGVKDVAVSFLQNASAGRVREAFEKHVAPGTTPSSSATLRR